MAGEVQETTWLIRNGFPGWIITTKYKQNYTCKNQWQSYSTEYYNVLDNRNNNSCAKKEKGNKTEKNIFIQYVIWQKKLLLIDLPQCILMPLLTKARPCDGHNQSIKHYYYTLFLDSPSIVLPAKRALISSLFFLRFASTHSTFWSKII